MDSPCLVRDLLLRDRVEARLAALLPPEGHALHDAMRAIALAPGKRLRPLLTLLAGEEMGCAAPALLDFACAVEMVHAASLVLDDLPCMDDATLRRGQPAAHIRFGQDAALLAAIGLLNQAYRAAAMTRGPCPALAGQLVETLAEAVGPDGLVRGQFDDLRPSRRPGAAFETNGRKTVALFMACAQGACLIAGVGDERRASLLHFAASLGHAFQLLDDLLDRRASPALLGKDTNQDGGRATVAALSGEDEAEALLRVHLGAALHHAAVPGGSGVLRPYVTALFRRHAPGVVE